MMHGGDRWHERARNIMEPTQDSRQEWQGGPDVSKKLTKERATAILEDAPTLLKKYLAMHGDWREITSHTDSTFEPRATHSWEFTICQCALCQEAEKLVGHPGTPNG